MTVDRPLPASQQPSACFSCHALGIASTSALGVYMFYQAKKANSSTHRFTCALFGLDNDKYLSSTDTNDKNAKCKSLPVWFVHLTVYIAPDDDTLDHTNSLLNNTKTGSTIIFPLLNSATSNITNSQSTSCFFIFASHRVSSLFKDISRQRIAAGGRLQRSLEERR
ncbi:unnamed protein product [Rotaria sordida]|uniref:Uncharacterized protein n=1 Tax=Rotaria sordida TaxID=392033 RepID=A0A815E6C7_9BILA|nr:unnamed protein product [Rotaria sordida]